MRVRSLSFVQVAINRGFLAVAMASAIPSPILAAQAPVTASFYPPPPASASNANLDDIRLSFGSFGSSGVVHCPVVPAKRCRCRLVRLVRSYLCI